MDTRNGVTGKLTGDLSGAAAARKAAEEAARKAAAEAAARKAAEEAAKKAAQEAAKEAAKKAAQEAAAKQALAQASANRFGGYGMPAPSHPPQAKPQPKPAPKSDSDEKPGFFGRLWGGIKDAGKSVADGAESAAKKVGKGVDYVADQVEDGAHYVADKVEKGVDYVVDKVEDGAKDLYKSVIDPKLDKSVLGKDDEFSGEKTGALGDALTNRLDVGESVSVRLEAQARINGVEVGAGAMLEVKRVQKTDAEGKAVEEPKDAKGRPPTELEITVVADARVGASLALDAPALSKGAGIKGDRNLGVHAEAGIELRAGVQAQGEMKFRFDPSNAQDMKDMTGIFKTAGKTALESAIPGIGAVLAASNAPDLAKDASAFGRHMTEMSGQVGAYATAEAYAGVGVGLKGNEKAENDDNRSFKDQALDELRFSQAGIDAAIGGEVNIGARKDFRAGTTTMSFSMKAEAGISANGLGMEKGASAAQDNKLNVTYGKDGKIASVTFEESLTKADFEGVGNRRMAGKGLNKGLLAQLEEEDTITITRTLTPSQLEAFKKEYTENKAGAIAGAWKDLKGPDPAKTDVESVVGTHTTTMDVGLDLWVIGGSASLGHGQEVELTAK